MKTFLNTIVLFALATFLCYGQTDNFNSIANDTIKEIIDPVENMPFSIERDSVYTKVPDSLGVNLTGMAVIKLYINNKSIVEKIEILRLLINKNNHTIINYTQNLQKCKRNKHYPNYILKYYPFLYDYAQKIKIVKVSETAKRLTNMSLMIRFK